MGQSRLWSQDPSLGRGGTSADQHGGRSRTGPPRSHYDVTLKTSLRTRIPELVPAGAVTGIGSLPIADPGEAVDFVVSSSPRLPFCPQPRLVHLAEDTLAQLNGHDEVQGTWLEQFAHAVLAGAFPQAIGVKTQRPAQ